MGVGTHYHHQIYRLSKIRENSLIGLGVNREVKKKTDLQSKVIGGKKKQVEAFFVLESNH